MNKYVFLSTYKKCCKYKEILTNILRDMFHCLVLQNYSIVSIRLLDKYMSLKTPYASKELLYDAEILLVFLPKPVMFTCRVRGKKKNKPTKVSRGLHIEVENKAKKRRWKTSKLAD